MKWRRLLFVIMLAVQPIVAHADLVPWKLSMRIYSNEKDSTNLTIVNGKIAQLTVTFTNADYSQRSVLLPGSQNQGQ